MKRLGIPVLLIACASAFAVSHRPATSGTAAIPAGRSEAAGGNVVLRDDDEKAKARAKVRNEAAGTYIPEILLQRDSALARWHERSAKPVTVWVQSAPELRDWNDAYVESVSAAFMEWDS